MIAAPFVAGVPAGARVALAMTIPVAIIFFVFQKYIMRTGEGAIKE